MDRKEVAEQLHGMGCKITDTQINSQGRSVYLIKLKSGRSAARFHRDAVDLVSGAATLEEIIARNKGANLADPWPVPDSTAD